MQSILELVDGKLLILTIFWLFAGVLLETAKSRIVKVAKEAIEEQGDTKTVLTGNKAADMLNNVLLMGLFLVIHKILLLGMVAALLIEVSRYTG